MNYHAIWKRLPVLLLMLAIMAGGTLVLGARTTSATHVEPIFVEGNQTCGDLAAEFGGGQTWTELKVEPVVDGTFTDGTLSVTIDVRDTAQGQVFDWTSNTGVDAVFAKGGPDGNLYLYDPPGPEATSDTGLHSPVNESNDRFFGLSHISFCYDAEPSVAVDKSGDELSKVGDTVTYTFEVTNTGDFVLYLDTITDTVIGDLETAATAAGCDVLDLGETCTFTVDYTIPAGSPDPLPNTVTVVYNTKANLTGTSVTDFSSHEVNLFQPAIRLVKEGDSFSKIGDEVAYTITLFNDSSNDSPDLVCTISDPTLGFTKDVTLASGANDASSVPFTIPDGAGDPFENTATATCSPQGFPNVLEASDSHEVNLFQPTVEVDKSGTELSKVGDLVTYTIVVTNTSSDDSPDLVNGSIVDSLLGDLLDPLNPFVTGSDCTATLATGASCTITAERTVDVNDPDPLPNTVTVHYNPDGFPNDISDSDSHEVNLFQPSVRVDKQGDTLSKVGDTVTYNFKITNTSSVDSPNLVLASISDTLLGDLSAAATAAGCVELAPGAMCEFNVDRVVQPGDPDPLPNRVEVLYHPDGFPNDVADAGTHEVNLFQPGVTVDKSGDTLSKAGDEVVYTFTITNTSSDDSPNLVLASVSDTLLGDLTAAADAAGCGSLASGASCNFSATRTVLDGDPDPLENTVTVLYHPDGFPNDITASDDHAVDLVHPDYTLVKECGPSPARVGDVITYTFTITNTGDVTLNPVSVFDTLLGDITGNFPSLAPGDSAVIQLTRAIQAGDPDPLPNTVTAVYQVEGLPNHLTREASCEVDIEEQFEGCTPGFWKTHPEAWVGFATDQTLQSVFEVPDSFGLDNVTLIQALDFGGGPGAKGAAQILLRAAVASILNAEHPDVNFPMGTGDVIASVNAALASGNRATMLNLAAELDALNNAGCPL